MHLLKPSRPTRHRAALYRVRIHRAFFVLQVLVFLALLTAATATPAAALHARSQPQPQSPSRPQSIELQSYRFDPLAAAPALPPSLVAQPPAAGDEVLAIVQFDGPITAARRTALAAAVIEIVDYLPDFAYLVRVAAPLPSPALAACDGVRWTGLYQPGFRLSPLIGAGEYVNPERATASTFTLRVEVVGDRSADVAAAVRALGGEVESTTAVAAGRRHRLQITLPKGRQVELARHPDVIWIEEVPDYRLCNNTTRWVVQSNVSGATPIWNQGLHGENRIVGLLDSGLDYASCWFRDNGNPPPGPTHRKVIHYSLWGGNAYDGCDIGHGTHVSGTIAGDQSFINPGNYNYNGMAYAARIVFQDIGQDDFLSCLFGLVNVPSSLVDPFEEAYDLGARVHTNSWGSTSNTYDSMARDVDDFMWSHPDCLVLFAAGNWGPGSGTVGSPGTAKDCVTVGATRQAPEQNTMAGYSSRGPASDGRLKPTVTAPGGESPNYITSADNDPDSNPTCNTASSPFQGTSMATPAVAGLAMLVQQYFTEGWYPGGAAGAGPALTPSAALVKAVITNAATDMATLDIPNNNEGWGRLLLDDGLYFAGDARELRIEEHPGLATGEQAVYEYVVDDGGEPLEIVLVWTDFPAAVGSGVNLVNDLDLTVTAPGGAVYRGNVFAGGQSTTGGSLDRRNVEEVVRLAAPAAGTYTIAVDAYNVPQGGAQPFAVAATGAFGSWPPGGAAIADGEPAAGGAAADAVAPGVRRQGALALHVARPNPFNPAVEIRYELYGEASAQVRIEIYDSQGRAVRTIVDAAAEPGMHSVRWDGRDDAGRAMPSGTYFVGLAAGESRLTDKLVLLR